MLGLVRCGLPVQELIRGTVAGEAALTHLIQLLLCQCGVHIAWGSTLLHMDTAGRLVACIFVKQSNYSLRKHGNPNFCKPDTPNIYAKLAAVAPPQKNTPPTEKQGTLLPV